MVYIEAMESASSIRARSPHPSSATRTPGEESKSSDGMQEAELGGGADDSKQDGIVLASSNASSRSGRVPRRMANIQFASMCCSLFLAGWNDGTTGPLLPRIQSVYHVGFAVVSLIFVCNCIGFVVAATANVALTDRFGFGTVMVIGSVAQMIGYALEAPAPPFPVFVIGYAVNGFGISLQDAGANGYVASLENNSSTKMGIMHAVYGLGALSSPLVATQFAQRQRWSFHYLVSLSIACLNTIILIVVIRFRTQDECLAEIGQPPPERTAAQNENKYKQIFRLRALHFLAVFIFVYVGVEVTIGGWIVTYIIDVRSGGTSSGYISSGFFGGNNSVVLA
ncbi:hypothetical protein AcW1_009483 [Taiwanofungus camphoratus]|nr:hypothetical protein AcV7_006924 [Antrodia cinnamomea]KAI0947820.1 hypothetical protein AcW1_009483 [Antrodia cinnamomea]